MPIEALAWSLLLLLSPALSARLWPLLRERFNVLPLGVVTWAPWIHSLVLPYLAIILGSVSGRKMGLYGQPMGTWVAGLLACGFGLAVAIFLAQRRETHPDPEVDFTTSLLEESRWAFYRGAAALWLPGIFSLLLGFGLAITEFAMGQIRIGGQQPPASAGWKLVMRAAFSTLLFFATGNFWMTAGTQLILNTRLNKLYPN